MYSRILAEARTKAAVSGVGLRALGGISTWLWRIYVPASPIRAGRGANIDRIGHIWNELLSIAGMPFWEFTLVCLGFFWGLLLIFRWGLFLDHANEAVLGLFVFLAGYIGIIAGCAYWLKAKGWSEALVAIGFMPFGIFATPIVRRLILFASPLLLPVGLFMMSLILIAVVVTLPDKSGMGRRRKTRHRVHRSRSGDRGF